MRTWTLDTAFLIFLMVGLASAQTGVSLLVPPVKEWHEGGSSLILRFPVVLDAQDESASQVLTGEIQLCGGSLASHSETNPRVLIGLADDKNVVVELGMFGLTNRVPAQPESYLIAIETNGVLLTARDKTGLYYAAQTLRQLMRPVAGGIMLPVGVIRDWPEMSFRGLSVDMASGVVPTDEQMRHIIQTCSEYKLNVVSFYMEHAVSFKSTPLLAPKDAELSHESLRRLVSFAAEHHVTLLPQQQMFGHLHRLLTQELYADWGELPHQITLAAGKPEVYRWLENVADELTSDFPGTLFHAGGDETVDLGKGVNRQAALATNGVGRLWVEHMTRVADILRKHGRRTLFWGDIPMKNQAVIPMIPRDMIAATWTYNADDPFANYITPFRKAGLDVIVCPSVNNWSKPAPDFDVAITNTGRFVAEGRRQGALGMLNTVWFDDGESFFDVVWYPVLYSASAAWEGADVSRKKFDEGFDWAFYRVEGTDFAEAINKLGKIHALARKAGVGDAANEYVWVDPFSGRGVNLYKRLMPQAAGMRRLAEDALTMILQKRNQCRLHTGTLDYLEFAARRMDWLGMRVEFSSDMVDLYRDACEHVKDTHRVFYRLEYVSSIDGRAQDLRDTAGEMKRQYQALWCAVNRPYLLNSMVARYDRELLFWLDKAARLDEARAQYRRFHTLPEPSAIGLCEH